MVKVKSKSNFCEDGAPVRSLRSRKGNFINQETSQTVEAAKDPQKSEEKEGVVAILQQCPLPECVVVMGPQFSLTNQNLSANEKHTEATNEATDIHQTTDAVPQQETTVINSNSDCPLNVSEKHTDGDELKNGNEEEEVAVEGDPSCTVHFQSLQSTTEEANGSCEAALENPVCMAVDRQSHSEKNEEACYNQPSDSCTSETNKTKEEVTVGVPPKKKRRMGMCVLTEKERDHFLQAQKCDSGQNGMARAEKQINDNTEEKPAEKSSPSPCFPSSLPSVLEEPQSSHDGDFDSSKIDVHSTATISGGTDTVCDPEGKICEAEPAAVVSVEEMDHPKQDQFVKEEEAVEELVSQQLQESKESEIPEKPVKLMEDEPLKGCCDLDITDHTSSNEASGHQEGVIPPVTDATEAQIIEEEDVSAESVSASSTEPQAGEINCGSVEISEAAVKPSVSERTDQSDPDPEASACPPAENAEHTHTTDTSDPFGSTYLDYVSDSQLNTIDLIVEKETSGLQESSRHREDCTNLVCGLIRELSSLNRKVMAAHRELEVFHRRGRSSRSFLR